MAWKQLRPKFLRTLWSSLYFGFLISVLSATIVGMISIPVYYLGFQTQLNCEDHPKESIPTKLQWVITTSKISFVCFLYYWFFLNILFFFRPFQISGLKLNLVLLCLLFYFLDSAYRIALQVFGISHSKLTPTQRTPVIILFFLSVCLQIYIIARHFCQRSRIKQLKLMLLLIVPCVLAFVVAVLAGFFYIPSLQQARQIWQSYICNICTSYRSFFQSNLSYLHSEVMVSNQPSGNFIRAAGPIVLWVSGNDASIASGSSEFRSSCSDWSGSWDRRSL